MASFSSTSCITAASLPRVGPSTSSASLVPCFHRTSNPRSTNFRRIRCQVEDQSAEQQPVTSVTPPPATATPLPPPPKAPAVNTKFFDILSFGGPAPERINGRLAMVGFVSALAVEVAKGDDLMAQISNGGFAWFIGTAAVLSLASLVPLLKGVTVQSKSGGLMTSDAEMWNGRFAMLGLLALAYTEFLKGGPLV